MKEGYIVGDQTKAHLITATVVDWVDVLKAASFVKYNHY
jgi:hypothetical protein